MTEVLDREVKKIEAAGQLHPRHVDQVDREPRRNQAENEGADQAVGERLLVGAPGQAKHHDGDHERVVRAQQAFQNDQKADGDEVEPGHEGILCEWVGRGWHA